MGEKEMAKCDFCGKMVPEHSLSLDMECSSCRANDKATDMTVGDLNSK